jgi:hypothetical protein
VEHWQAKKLATIQTTTNLLVMTKKLVGYDLVTIQTHPNYFALFHSLERLSLSGCNIDLATFIPRCPRLRLLSLNATDLVDVGIITIHSARVAGGTCFRAQEQMDRP